MGTVTFSNHYLYLYFNIILENITITIGYFFCIQATVSHKKYRVRTPIARAHKQDEGFPHYL